MYFRDKNSGEVWFFNSAEEKDEFNPYLIEMSSAEVVEHESNNSIKQGKIYSVSRAQGKIALINAGLWEDVLNFVSSIEDKSEKAIAEISLHDASVWNRDSPFLNNVSEKLGISESDLDNLFYDASLINI